MSFCFPLNSVEAQEGIAIIFGRKSWECISGIKFFCLVNVFLFQFKVHRGSAFFLLSRQKNRRESNFAQLDFLIKQGKVGIWFIVYLRQNVYKSILLFPKTILFLAILLVCGRCHLRMNALDHNSNVATLENQKSYNNFQSSRTLVS